MSTQPESFHAKRVSQLIWHYDPELRRDIAVSALDLGSDSAWNRAKQIARMLTASECHELRTIQKWQQARFDLASRLVDFKLASPNDRGGYEITPWGELVLEGRKERAL